MSIKVDDTLTPRGNFTITDGAVKLPAYATTSLPVPVPATGTTVWDNTTHKLATADSGAWYEDGAAVAPMPTITSISDLSVVAGDVITVRGTGFSSVSEVHIGGGICSFSIVGDGEMTVTVSEVAASGHLFVLNAVGSVTGTDTITVTLAPPSDSYGLAVVADTPKLWYRLRQAPFSGAIADASGNGHGGVLHGTPVTISPGVVSGAANVPQGTGSSTWITVNSDIGWPTGKLTVEFFYVPVSDGGGTPMNDIGVSTDGFSGGGLAAQQVDNTPLSPFTFVIGNDAGVFDGSSIATPNTGPHVFVEGQRAHVVFTYDDDTGTGTIYVDGVLIGSNPGMRPTNGMDLNVHVMGWARVGGWRGQLQEFALYDVALDASRVLAHFNAA